MGRSQELANHIKDDVFVSKTSNRQRYAKMNAKLIELVNADRIIGRVIRRVKDSAIREAKLYCITDETEVTIILQRKMKELVAYIRETNAGNIVRSNGKLTIKSNGSNAFALLGLSQKYNISMSKRNVIQKRGTIYTKKNCGNNMGLTEQVGNNHVRIMNEIHKIHCGICNKLMNGKTISLKSRKLHCCDECLDILENEL